MVDDPHLIKEGWLMKRGEYIKTWRPRYFRLFSDGSFLGYREKLDDYNVEPENDFSVKRCQIMKTGKQKTFSFVIRCFQLSVVIERTFAVDTSVERELWLTSIENVSANVIARTKLRQGSNKTHTKYSLYKPTMTVEDFELLKVLGKGTFGKVMMVKEKKTGKIFAMKLLRKDVILEKGEVEHTLTENRVLQSAKHPFLTELKYSFQTTDRLVFVMEYVKGGELFYHLSKEKRFSVARSRFYAAEMTLALKYLHENKIIYRDMKLENLLLDEHGHIKITDFGLCKEEISFSDTTKTFCGTPEYLAPEVLEDHDYGLAVDWWGFGVVLYEMLLGRLPFFSRNHEGLFEMILTKPVQYPPNIDLDAKSIIDGLLEKNPKKRLGGSIRDAEEVMEHAFFTLISWNDIFQKKIPPPFKPLISSETDSQNFSCEFTDLDPKLSISRDSTPEKKVEQEPPAVTQERKKFSTDAISVDSTSTKSRQGSKKYSITPSGSSKSLSGSKKEKKAKQKVKLVSTV